MSVRAANHRGANPLNELRHAADRHRTAVPPHHQEDVMSQLVAYVNRITRNEEGQDLLEYALLVALIALVALAAVAAAGTSVSGIFQAIAGALGGAA
jgi:pilus assembly protein Flp/PilA